MWDKEKSPAREPRGLHRYNQNKKWTVSEERELLRLRGLGYDWSKVGASLHRTKMAVVARYKFMRRRKVEAAWSEEERERYKEEKRRAWRENSRRYKQAVKEKRKQGG